MTLTCLKFNFPKIARGEKNIKIGQEFDWFFVGFVKGKESRASYVLFVYYSDTNLFINNTVM